MLAPILALTLVAELLSPDASQQPVPNPVEIDYGLHGEHTSYSVDCLSAPRVPGTWVEITGSVFTDQDALIYRPIRGHHISILYCMANDGHPGIIQGAPQGIMLAAGTRVVVHPLANVRMSRIVNGQNATMQFAIPLDGTTLVEAGPEGIFARFSEHRMNVYPPGATLNVGSGEMAAYFRPGDKLIKVAPVVESGCTVTFVDAGNTERERHYDQNCSLVQRQKPWSKKP